MSEKKRIALIIGGCVLVVLLAAGAIVLGVKMKTDSEKVDNSLVASSEVMESSESKDNDAVLFPDETKAPEESKNEGNDEVVETPELSVEIIIGGEVVGDITEEPTSEPTEEPTAEPSKEPEVTKEPVKTEKPKETEKPVVTKAPEKTATPTVAPTKAPTPVPTVAPTKAPVVTAEPTKAPVVTVAPTAAPTPVPTVAPTEAPVVCSHEWVEDYFLYPTCTAHGWATPVCVHCGLRGQDHSVDALGHDYEATLAYAGNCRSQAVYKNICKVCGWEGPASYGPSLDPDKHEWIEVSGEVWNNDTFQWEWVTTHYCGWCGKNE